MTLLVSDPRSENFDKPPPPKKKWIQDYLEKECNNVKENRIEDGDNPIKIEAKVQKVIDHFQDYIDETNKKHGKFTEPSSPAENKNMASMLTSNSCGVKFNNCIKELARHVPPVEAPDMSKQEIGGVVQEVISQFLNGSLADAGYRHSRKRSHRSAKSKEGKFHVHQTEPVAESRDSAEGCTPPKSIKQNPEPPLIKDENGVLNLSLPKTAARVTFSSKDDCYSTDSFHTSQASKSQEMKDLDVFARASQSCEAVSMPSYLIDTSARLPHSLAHSGLKQAVIYTNSLKHKPQALSGTLSAAVGPAIIAPPTPQKLSVIMPVPVEKLISPSINTSSYSMESILSKSPTPPNTFLHPQPSFNDMPTKKPDPKTPNKSSMAKATSPAKVSGCATISKELKSQSASKTKDESKKYSCREVHNRLEKNRRALLKKNFDELAVECELDPKKASNLTVIRSAYKYVMGLKRQERENEKELSNLVKEKIRMKQLLETLKREMPGVLPEGS